MALSPAPFGIRVNAICPAGMPFTNFMAAGGMDTSQVDVQEVGQSIMAEDAEAAVYLASDRAANGTGVLLPVDGDHVAR